MGGWGLGCKRLLEISKVVSRCGARCELPLQLSAINSQLTITSGYKYETGEFGGHFGLHAPAHYYCAPAAIPL